VRTLHADVTGGINRIDWDMHYDPLVTIRLRTIPPENPHIWDDARFKGKDWRPITHWGMPSYQAGPLIVPGSYKVSLTVGGKTFDQPLTVLPDPSAPGSQSDLQKSLDLQLRIRSDVDHISAMVNLIEHQRHQLEELRAKNGGGLTPQQIDAMDGKLQSVEYELFQKALAASDDKYYVSAWKLYYNLLWLNGEIGSGAGDVAGGEGYGPTDTTPPLLGDLEAKLANATGHYDAVMATDVPAFNKQLVAKGQAPLMTTLPEADREAPDRELSESFDYAEPAGE
jgi:hypothetical protein